jgi:beta-barrel assembly-enhancing protease
MKRYLFLVIALAAGASTSYAGQLGGLGKGLQIAKKANDVRDLAMTDAEEQQLGQNVSEKIRRRYGVMQDANVHKYVSLVGLALAQSSTRPALPWTFIVLDTDGVNAFAAPGGYIHITRGALALANNESELACLLAHEITHVTAKHTIRAIQKTKAVQMGASETLSGSSALMEKAVNAVYENIVDKGFGRDDENESDEVGAALANKVGYAPNGLVTFLTSLKERNKNKTAKSGLFATHPQMQERLDRINKQIKAQKLMASATAADRYKKNISFTLVDPDALTAIEAGSAGAVGGNTAKEPPKEEAKKEEPKKGRFGLPKMLAPGGGEQKNAQVMASGGARGGVPDEKDAKGGSNPAIVAVKLSPADVAAFKKDGGLS